jgi:hypothetical protein
LWRRFVIRNQDGRNQHAERQGFHHSREVFLAQRLRQFRGAEFRQSRRW